LRFLPAVPATDERPIQRLGSRNALVEMARQSRAFVLEYAKEHLKLVGHLRVAGLDRQLGGDFKLEEMLDVAASGEWPTPTRETPIPAPRRSVAAAAGAPGQSATDASPSTRATRPQEGATTASVSSEAPPVHSSAPAAVTSRPHFIPPMDPAMFLGGGAYADAVRHQPSPLPARGTRGRGRGGTVVAGELRQGVMVALERRTPGGPRMPPPGFPARVAEREAPAMETASPSRDELPSAPEPTTHAAWRTDPTALARGMMVHLNGMVDLMLQGPLADFCQEEARELYDRFTVQTRPKQ